MAYRKSNGKLARRKKMEPAVQTFYFKTEQIQQNTSAAFYVDLSQVASLCNRRFYRQGINWMVGSIRIFTGTAGTVTVMKLPDTWVMKNAYTKALATWQRMNKESMDETESVRPRFLDFKIYADKDHHQAGFGANLMPLTLQLDPAEPAGLGTIAAAPGEWVPSKVHIPIGNGATPSATFEREFIAVGANYPGAGASTLDAVSIIEGYAASRGLPNITDPNAPTDADDAAGNTPANWIAATSNEGTDRTEEVIEDMISENNQAPYPFENGLIPDGGGVTWDDTQYPGGANQLPGMQVHDLAVISNTTVGGTTYVKGGEFPCGLIKFIHTPTGTSANVGIQIDMVPGPHRGYLCEKMGA